MILHIEITDAELQGKIKNKKIAWGGNRKLRIYGTLSCASGKKLKRVNRVFFSSEKKALEFGYRPCGHCMKENYLKWKNEII